MSYLSIKIKIVKSEQWESINANEGLAVRHVKKKRKTF